MFIIVMMKGIEEFIRENYTPMVNESKLGISCLFKHKSDLIDESVVYFEFAKKQCTKKPIMSNRQYVIVDADTRDLIDFLNSYYNLTEENYNDVRRIIVDMAIETLDKYYGNDQDYKSLSVMICFLIQFDIRDLGK